MKKINSNKQLKFNLIIALLVSFNVSAEVFTEASDCNTALNKGEVEVAFKAGEKAIQNHPKDFESLTCYGRALTGKAQYDESLVYFKRAFEASADPFEQTAALSLTAGAYKNAQNFEQALPIYQQALALARKHNIKRFERTSLNRIGDILEQKQQYKEAIEHYEKGLSLAANDNERADNQQHLAALYVKNQQLDLAVEQQIKAVISQKRSGDLDQYVTAQLELGRIYTLAKHYAKAEQVLGEMLKFSQDNGGAYYEAKADYYLAQLKLAQNNAEQAKSLLQQAEKIAKAINAEDLLTEMRQQ